MKESIDKMKNAKQTPGGGRKEKEENFETLSIEEITKRVDSLKEELEKLEG